MRVRVLSPAVDEVVDAALWFDTQRTGLGEQFWCLVDETLNQIESNPLRFPRSEYATEKIDLRFAIVPRFHYVIHFAINGNEVEVASVAHAARKPGYWLRRVKQ